jgi:hypothetical protein
MEKEYTKNGYTFKNSTGRVVSRSRDDLEIILAGERRLFSFISEQMEEILSDLAIIDSK